MWILCNYFDNFHVDSQSAGCCHGRSQGNAGEPIGKKITLLRVLYFYLLLKILAPLLPADILINLCFAKLTSKELIKNKRKEEQCLQI